jgi:hypothetical protein
MTKVKERLDEGRNWILKGELCSLLHDLGKLSKTFIEYRQTWYSRIGGWNDDPHEHDFLTRHDQYAMRTPKSKLIEALECPQLFPMMGKAESFYPLDIMTSHPKGYKDFNTVYEHALKAGDSLDSAHQRNNPLFSAEQTERRGDTDKDLAYPVFRSNVFGYESNETRLYPGVLDTLREKLYREAGNDIQLWWYDGPDQATRDKVMSFIREAFSLGLGDTTRPLNDTSLWDHTYSVASLTKAIQAAYCIYGAEAFTSRDYNSDWRNPPVSMWGIGWDPVKFIARGQRIVDMEARRKVMRDARSRIKDLVEFDWAIGNYIYEDDGAIVFIVPGTTRSNGSALPEDAKCQYEQEFQELQSQVSKEFLEISGQELWPRFSFQPAYTFNDSLDLTKIVKVLSEVRRSSGGSIQSSLLLKTGQKGSETDRTKNVCPICHIRIELKKERVCQTCQDRRLLTAKQLRKDRKTQVSPETPFLGEIADGNGRVALIAARIGLKHWLTGEMVRTTFVTEANGLEAELKAMEAYPAKDFEQDEREVIQEIKGLYPDGWNKYNSTRIAKEIEEGFRVKSDMTNPALAKATYFLYGYRTPGGKLIRGPEVSDNYWMDADVNLKIAKTPTASRLLNAWETTQELFDEFTRQQNSEDGRTIHHEVPKRARQIYTANEIPAELHEYQPYNGVTEQGSIEFTVEREAPNRIVIIRGEIDAGEGVLIGQITTSEGESIDGEIYGVPARPEDFSPFRVILSTPEMYLLLVPADRAIQVASALYKRFEEKFGKVIGRLPFSVGALFFQEHYPMFLVLDAGHRMLRNFEKLQEENLEHSAITSAPIANAWKVKDVQDGIITFTNGMVWNAKTKLGDKDHTDYYHPYFLVQNADSSRKTFQETPMGNVVHISDLQVGDMIEPPASVFDYEYLDSSTARFRIALVKNGRRPNAVIGGAMTRPIPIEALTAHVIDAWKMLVSAKIAESSLRDMVALLIAKLEQWRVALPITGEPEEGKPAYEWTQLVNQQVTYRLSSLTEPNREFVRSLILSGVFFEMAFLYLNILKQGLQKGDANA